MANGVSYIIYKVLNLNSKDIEGKPKAFYCWEMSNSFVIVKGKNTFPTVGRARASIRKMAKNMFHEGCPFLREKTVSVENMKGWLKI